MTVLDAHQTATDLRAFGDRDDPDGLEFNPRIQSLKENVAKFLSLDPYSTIMVDLRLLNPETTAYILHLVEEEKVEPPQEPSWRIASIEYDMWGDLVTDNSTLLQKIRNSGRSSRKPMQGQRWCKRAKLSKRSVYRCNQRHPLRPLLRAKVYRSV